MQRFMIEREIPGASELSQSDLADIATALNAVVESLGVPYTWVTSYVAGDKVYCVHEAEDAAVIASSATTRPSGRGGSSSPAHPRTPSRC